GYDNNWFVQGITPAQMGQLNADDRHPLVNKAIGEIYPPGSTFKMITGLSALTAGTATRNTVVNVSSTVMTVSGFNFYDWRAHGRLDFLNGFAHSSDIYFYTLAGGSPMGPGVVAAGAAAQARDEAGGSPPHPRVGAARRHDRPRLHAEPQAPDRRQDRHRGVRRVDREGQRGPESPRLPQLVRLVRAAAGQHRSDG